MMQQIRGGVASALRSGSPQLRVLTTVAGIALAAAAIFVPLYGSPIAIDIAFQICALAILAVSWNLMAGAGLISLGHSAFWGLGSYTAILAANRFGFGLAASLLPAALAGAVLGAVLALMTGRLRGIYFAISTLAASEGLRVLAVMLPDLTGGSNGIYLDSTLSAAQLTVHMTASLGAIGAALIAWWLARSRYHFALRAMRDNESASQMLGIEPLRYRVAIMAISGAMASFAGAVNMWRGGYLDPSVAFDLLITINAQIAPILGGIYTPPGPIIGAIATVGISELTRTLLGQIVGASLLVFGVVLVVIVLGLPNGVYGAARRLLPGERDRQLKAGRGNW
jgi:branched-chain amino acid transport system permease protein